MVRRDLSLVREIVFPVAPCRQGAGGEICVVCVWRSRARRDVGGSMNKLRSDRAYRMGGIELSARWGCMSRVGESEEGVRKCKFPSGTQNDVHIRK